MGEGLQFLDIIFFVMVAGFVLLRLRSVLGRRTGHERRRQDPFTNKDEVADDNVVSLPNRGDRDPAADKEAEAKLWADDSPVGPGLTQIKIADRSFEPGEFLGGARAAYEMIVLAFADGRRDDLKMLLNDEVYENFAQAIQSREDAGQTMETSITDLRGADIVEAGMNGRNAEVTVKFVSDMISVVRDQDGEMVPGSNPAEHEVVDIWTFARDVDARDPNWALVSTRSEN